MNSSVNARAISQCHAVTCSSARCLDGSRLNSVSNKSALGDQGMLHGVDKTQPTQGSSLNRSPWARVVVVEGLWSYGGWRAKPASAT